MEHLVYVHDLEVYHIDSRNKDEILEPCEECGKRDSIYLSWEEGKREEVLDKFLTGNDKSPVDVEEAFKKGQTKNELIMGTHIYFSITRNIIDNLYMSGSITREKHRELTKQNRITEKKQLIKIKKDTRKKSLRKILENNN